MAVETIVNAAAFLEQTALDINPDGDFREGTALFDLLIKPMAALLQPVLDDIADIALRQSLARLNDLSDEDVDELMANIFVTRRGGSKTTGTARMFFDQATSFVVPSGTVFTSSGGLRFTTELDQSITQAAMALNTSGGLFFFDVAVVAEEEGEQFNIGPNEIVEILLTDAAIALVDNEFAFAGGIERENNADFFARGIKAIATRDQVTKPGIDEVLLENFAFIRAVQPVGAGDPEMIRDEMTGQNLSLGGLSFGTADKVNVGGKVDVYFQVDALSQKTLDIDPADVRNRLRARDQFDVPGVDEVFVVKGGLVSTATATNGDTVVASNDLALVANELAGSKVKFLTGKEARNTFTVLSNTAGAVTLSGDVDAEAGDAFTVIDVLFRPIIRILQIEEINPATKDGIGVFLVESQDFVFEVETPSVRLSDAERVSLLLTEFSGTATSVGTDPGLDTVITDTALTLTVSLLGRTLRITSGAAFGEEFTVLNSTTNTITIAGDQTAKIVAGNSFVILGGPNVGRSFRLTYETQEQVTQIQDFILSPLNRVATADMLAKAANAVFIDLSVSVVGAGLDVAALVTAIEEFIREDLGFSSALELSDIIDLIYDTTGATREALKVRLPLTASFERRAITGPIETGSSQDALETDRTEVFVPRTIIVTEA